MVYATILKTGAFLTAVMAIAVIGVSSWILSSTFFITKSMNNGLENNTFTYNEDNETNWNLQYSNKSLNKIRFTTSDSNISVLTTKLKMETFWEDKPARYKMLMQAFSGTSTVAGLIQLALSWMVICGNMKNIRERVKLWQLANFVIFLLLMICIAVPLTFSVKKDAFLGSRTFWNQFLYKLKNFGLKHIEGLNYNILTESLDGYFIILIINDIILLTILNFTCCCLCYSCKENAYSNV